jgi:phosphatidylglycerophosphate synthase
MRASGIKWTDRISLARIGLAFMFLACFRATAGGLLTISIASALIAQATDHVDGYLVRRFFAPSVSGWVYDSFADRSFYIAALLAFEREYVLNEFLVWTFILRELALYAIRVVVGDFETLAPGFRKLALFHAAVTRVAIAEGCIIPYLPSSFAEIHFYVALLTLTFAGATLIGFFNLFFLIRNLR